MTEALPAELLTWTFAAAVAWFLLKWVRDTINSQLTSITEAIRHQSLINLELYRLFLIHDAQSRGLSTNPEDDMSAAHRLAYDEFQKLNESLSNLKEKLQ